MKINYVRDGLVEESHLAEFILYSEQKPGEDISPYYLRSCAKPLQASLLVDYGANLSSEEFALICGSHAGEDCHIEIAKRLLERFGLDESYLKCGVHAPLSRSMQDKMLIKGEEAGAIHNNCSGKHIGFLIACVLKHWDLETYYEPNHPLQIAVKEKINSLCEAGVNISNPTYSSTVDGNVGVNMPELIYPATTDGCGVPILSMPLRNMLIGYINLFKNPKYSKIKEAFLNYPYIIGGENRLDTEVIQNTENIIAKVGAGGLCIVVNTKINDGFIIKVHDAGMDARRFAVLEMINRLGWGNINYDNKIKTISGKIVGEIKVIL